MTTRLDGRSFENYDDYPAHEIGDVTFTTAIANSCNTALITERDRLGDGDVTRAGAALGPGVDHDLGFPAYFGQAPAPEGETEKAADIIGQGKILRQSDGHGRRRGVRPGRPVRGAIPALGQASTGRGPRGSLKSSEATTLRSMLRAVVTDGSGTFLADLPGEVGANTGTAEYGEPAADGSLPTHAWMIATPPGPGCGSVRGDRCLRVTDRRTTSRGVPPMSSRRVPPWLAHLPVAWLLTLVIGCAVAAVRRRTRRHASPAPLEAAHV